MEDIKKPIDHPDNGILLTPGSSRRKMAWKRLRHNKSDRGMTQDQVDKYLKTFMKSHYRKVQKEGALTFDKIERYLDYLAKSASKTLVKSAMDQKKVAGFTEKIKPVIEDVGSITAITEEIVEKHSGEIQQQAKQHLKDLQQPANQAKAAPGESIDAPEHLPGHAQKESEIPSPEQKKSKNIKTTPNDPATSGLMSREIIPIGFEDGAPLVSVEAFFAFPLAENEKEPESGNIFATHLRYLNLAVRQECLKKEDLESIQSIITRMPAKRYSRYFDIFPDDEYDDAQLMIIFSQWRNQTLKRFLIED